MNLLIIYAHPNHTSFNAEILRQIQKNLSNAYDIRTLDLYDENFNPVLHFDDKHKRRDLAKENSMEKYRQLITWADKLIFIFPIWWGGMPAILKGFIDRIFVSGFAYSYKKLGLEGHFTGKSAWIITTHNTPAIISRFFVADYGKILKNQVLKPCGIKPIKHTEVAHLEKLSDHKRQKILDSIAQSAKRF